MTKKYTKYKMILLWIFVGLIGAFLTIISGMKISDEGSKEIISKLNNSNHPIPEHLYMDFALEIEADSVFKEILAQKVLTKISIPMGNIDTLEPVPLNSFFDEISFQTNAIADKNYNIKSDYFERLRNIEIIGLTSEGNTTTGINFNSDRKQVIKFTENQDIDEYCSITIEKYSKTSNLVSIKFKNVKLLISTKVGSGNLIDIKDSKFEMFLLYKNTFKINRIENLKLKTKQTTYYSLNNIKLGELGEIKGDLKMSNF